MAKIKRRDWLTDIHVRYLSFGERDAMEELYRRALTRQRRARVMRALRFWR